MPSPLNIAAQDALGPSGVEREREFFTPVAFDTASTIQSRYRQALDFMDRDRMLSEHESEMAKNSFAIAEADRRTQALRRENEALNAIKQLDPLDSSFEQKAIEYIPDAAYSRAVDAAISIKTGQREQMMLTMDGIAETLGSVGLPEKKQERFLSQAEELLRNRDHSGVRRMSARLVSMYARKQQLDELRGDAQDKQIAAAERSMREFESERDEALVELPVDVVESFPGFFNGGDVNELGGVASALTGKLISDKLRDDTILPDLVLPSDEAPEDYAAIMANDAMTLGEKAFVDKYTTRNPDDQVGASNILQSIMGEPAHSARTRLSEVYRQIRKARELSGAARKVGEQVRPAPAQAPAPAPTPQAESRVVSGMDDLFTHS